MKKILINGFVLGSMILVAGCGTTASDTYKIGVIAPMSGDAGAYGVEVKKVIDYQLEKINENSEKKFEAVFEDGRCDGGAAKTAFQKMTDVDGIKFFIGGFCSSESKAIAPDLNDKGVLALSLGSSAPDLEGKSPNFMSLSYSDEIVGDAIAAELAKYETVALINEQNDYNVGIKNTVEKVLKEKYPNVTVVANEDFTKGSTDFRNMLQKIKSASPKVILLNSNAGLTSEALARQLAEIKDFDAKFVAPYPFAGEATIAAAPERLAGTIVVDAPGIDGGEYKTLTTEMFNQIGGETKNLGTFYTATTLDAVNAVTEIMKKTNADVEASIGLLRNGQVKNGFSGSIKFEGNTFRKNIGAARYMIDGGKLIAQ